MPTELNIKEELEKIDREISRLKRCKKILEETRTPFLADGLSAAHATTSEYQVAESPLKLHKSNQLV